MITFEDLGLTDKEMEDFHQGSKLLFADPPSVEHVEPEKPKKKPRPSLSKL